MCAWSVDCDGVDHSVSCTAVKANRRTHAAQTKPERSSRPHTRLKLQCAGSSQFRCGLAVAYAVRLDDVAGVHIFDVILVNDIVPNAVHFDADLDAPARCIQPNALDRDWFL